MISASGVCPQEITIVILLSSISLACLLSLYNHSARNSSDSCTENSCKPENFLNYKTHLHYRERVTGKCNSDRDYSKHFINTNLSKSSNSASVCLSLLLMLSRKGKHQQLFILFSSIFVGGFFKWKLHLNTEFFFFIWNIHSRHSFWRFCLGFFHHTPDCTPLLLFLNSGQTLLEDIKWIKAGPRISTNTTFKNNMLQM